MFAYRFDSSRTIAKLKDKISILKQILIDSSSTAKLWLQYMNYVSIIKEFVHAETSGNWQTHLTAMGKLLNFLAVTGHINYPKSGRLYLQRLLDLEINYPWSYHQFNEKGFHCIRRRDKFWAGLWTDLVIEQTMMRSIKSLGGLTKQRGMDESTRNIWMSTLHNCAAVEETMRQVTKTTRQNSEQHVELGQSRRMRDFEDLIKLYTWLK